MKFKQLFEDFSMEKDVVEEMCAYANRIVKYNSALSPKVRIALNSDEEQTISKNVKEALKDLKKDIKKDDFDSIRKDILIIAQRGDPDGYGGFNSYPTEVEMLTQMEHPASLLQAMINLHWPDEKYWKMTDKKEAYEMYFKWLKNRKSIFGFLKRLF